MEMSMEQELALAHREAYSIESMPPNRWVTRKVGVAEDTDGWFFEFVQDNEGAYWYRTLVRQPDGRIVSLAESVHGRAYVERQRRRGKRYVHA